MTLPVPQLDNRTFQSIVDEAKRKIPELLPEWTNHNVSDPGVALIELFAWMTELTLFRLNQVPDAFYTHMLNLIGFEPFPATAATADLTFWLVAPTADAVKIDKGTAVATAGLVGEQRVFATVEDLIITQPTLNAALTSVGPDQWTDAWNDLKVVSNTRQVVCFPRQPKPLPDDCFYLGFESSLARSAIELTVKGPIQGIGIDPKRPPLVWEVSVEDVWVPCHVIEGSDTTGGLNCEGRLVLLIPAKHDRVTLGATSAFWLRARLVPAKPGQPEYQSSPQIVSISAATIGGTVTAEHSEPIGREDVGMSINKPGQVFHVQHAPILPRNDDEKVVVVVDNESEVWATVDDFIDSGPLDKHVVWNSSSGEVRFGPRIRQHDGTYKQFGAIPPEGARIAVTGYRHGGGSLGNVGKGTITSYRGAVPSVSRVENVFPATGGVDAETLEEAKLRGPQTLRAGERAVTAADFERLVKQADPSIARVRCLPPRKPDEPGAVPADKPVHGIVDADRLAPPEVPGLVRLLLVPAVKTPPGESQTIDDFQLTPDMVKRVTAFLDERRILGTSIELRPPYYQGISVAALVTPIRGRSAGRVQTMVLDTLYRALSPLGEGDDGGWPWETDLNSAMIYQLLESVDGVDRVDDVVLFEYDLRTGERVGFGRDVVKLEAHSLFLSAKHRVVVQ